MPSSTNANHLTPSSASDLAYLLEAEFARDVHKFESGLCPEFAVALQRCIPGSSIVVCSRSWGEVGWESTNELSHVVVEKGLHSFDAGGGDAIFRWEERWEGDYSDKPDDSVSFSWHEVSEDELSALVKMHREEAPRLDLKAVDRLSSRIARITEKALPRQSKLQGPLLSAGKAHTRSATSARTR